MSVSSPTIRELPILESGDRLTRDEFEHRYAAMPQLNKKEICQMLDPFLPLTSLSHA